MIQLIFHLFIDLSFIHTRLPLEEAWCEGMQRFDLGGASADGCQLGQVIRLICVPLFERLNVT
jgi:hypothetical protein